jgi:two-component system LytT family response regulator
MKSEKNKKESSAKEDVFIQRIIDLLISAIKNLPAARKIRQKIMLPSTKGYSFRYTDEIIYCTAADHFTIFYLVDKSELIVCMNLKDVQAILPEDGFMRIHDSNIINLNEVKEYIKGDGGIVIMYNGKELNVARSHKEELLRGLKESCCQLR